MGGGHTRAGVERVWTGPRRGVAPEHKRCAAAERIGRAAALCALRPPPSQRRRAPAPAPALQPPVLTWVVRSSPTRWKVTEELLQGAGAGVGARRGWVGARVGGVGRGVVWALPRPHRRRASRPASPAGPTHLLLAVRSTAKGAPLTRPSTRTRARLASSLIMSASRGLAVAEVCGAAGRCRGVHGAGITVGHGARQGQRKAARRSAPAYASCSGSRGARRRASRRCR